MPEPIPQGGLIEKLLKSTVSKTMIRMGKGTSFAIIGSISNVGVVGKVSSDYGAAQLQPATKPEGWVQVEANGLSGYCAAMFLVIEDVPTEPRYRLEFNGATMTVPRSTWLEMIQYHKLQAASLETIEPLD